MSYVPNIHDLERKLAAYERSPGTDPRPKIDALNDLAWALSDTELERAYALADRANQLARAPADEDSAYHAGMAYSLRTQGYLNQRFGKYTQGLAQLLEALTLLRSLALDDCLADVWDGIAGIHVQCSNYPEALQAAYQQLDAAKRGDDKRRILNAHNNLAVIYYETGAVERNREMLHSNLQLAREINHTRIECISLLNLTEFYTFAGETDRALAYGQRALQLSREAEYELFEAYAHHMLGQCYLEAGQVSSAIDHLHEALVQARDLESKTVEALVLLTLGEAYRDVQQPERARHFLHQAISVAQSIDSKKEVYQGHLLLSQVYEDEGNAVQALAHFKEHHARKELVANEDAEKRLQVLQVVHDTKAAQQEAEILQLKTVALEQQVAERTAALRNTVTQLRVEIEERRRADQALQQLTQSLEERLADRTQELATFFDLTVLGSQASSFSDVLENALPRMLEVTRSRAICIHLVAPDGARLQMAAQQNLPQAAAAQLQSVPVRADFQQWLGEPNVPLVTTDLPHLARIPAAFHFPEFQTYLGAQIKSRHRIEGVLSCFRFTERGFSLDEIALVTALAEQLGMVLETSRLRHDAEEMAVLEERQRLARDLHDSVTQSLYSLSLFSRSGLEAVADGDTERLTQSLTMLERNTLQTLREMRLLLYELRPADLEEEGLIRAVQLRLQTVESRVGLQLDVQLDALPALAARHEVDLYHILVEAMNNVVKHAAATRLTVRLTQSDGQVHLRIADDGRGFDPTQSTGGLGLQNIRERARRLRGTVSLSSAPGHGTSLEIEIPYPLESDPLQ